MSDTLHSILVIAVGFAVLIKGADWLVDGGSSIAKRYHVSELVIGLTLVSFGTSAPELVVNSFSAVRNEHGLVFGNIIGSNLFNTLLVLGVAGLIRPLPIRASTIWKEIPFSLLVTLVLLWLVNDSLCGRGGAAPVQNQLSRPDSIVLLGLFGLFLYYTYRLVRDGDPEMPAEDAQGADQAMPLSRAGLLFAAGAVALPVGAHLVVQHAVKLAVRVGASRKLIGLTLLAAGTSLPELAATGVAAARGKTDMAVSNVVGSNIFNVLLILGVSGVITPVTYDPVLNTDALFLVCSSVMVFLFIFTGRGREISRAEATMLVLGFFGYMTYVVGREYAFFPIG